MPKKYDRAYFDKWYRSRTRVTSFSEQRRKVSMVVANTEFFLHRPLKNVLDVGCGEAPWFVHLKALRPKLTYLGIDPSDYAVSAFADHRSVRRGSFTDWSAVKGNYDLIVCSDVLHYVNDADIRAGLLHLVKHLRGVAFLELFTKEDRISGDFDGFYRRPKKWYRGQFEKAGLIKVAPYMWRKDE